MLARTDDDHPHIAEWGLTAFSPTELRSPSDPLLTWLRSTGCTRFAIHFDVDTIDSHELVLGLGAEADVLRTCEVRRIVAEVEQVADVVGPTVAQYVPRQAMHLQQLLHGMPLVGSD